MNKSFLLTTVSGTDFFLPVSQYVSTLWNVFSTQAGGGNPMFKVLVSIFFLKHASPNRS